MKRSESPHPQPTQPPNLPAPKAETATNQTRPDPYPCTLGRGSRTLGRDRHQSNDDTRQRTQHYCSAARVAHACACSVRTPPFFHLKKKRGGTTKQKKQTRKLGGGGRGTQPPTAHAHRTQRAHRWAGTMRARTVLTHMHRGQQRDGTPRPGTPVNRSQVAQDTAHTKQHTEQAHR